MAWDRSTRRATLPTNWNSLRRAILLRDPVCALHYDCCTIHSTEVDHIGDRLDHGTANLRGVCHPCHLVRTKAQAATARANAPRMTMARAPERHPGMQS